MKRRDQFSLLVYTLVLIALVLVTCLAVAARAVVQWEPEMGYLLEKGCAPTGGTRTYLAGGVQYTDASWDCDDGVTRWWHPRSFNLQGT